MNVSPVVSASSDARSPLPLSLTQTIGGIPSYPVKAFYEIIVTYMNGALQVSRGSV